MKEENEVQTSREILEALAAWQEAWDRHDLDGVMELFHEEVLFENWTGARVKGERETPTGLDPVVRGPRRIPLHQGRYVHRRSPAEGPHPVAPRLALRRERPRGEARDTARRRRHPLRGREDHRETDLLQDHHRDRGAKDPSPSPRRIDSHYYSKNLGGSLIEFHLEKNKKNQKTR